MRARRAIILAGCTIAVCAIFIGCQPSPATEVEKGWSASSNCISCHDDQLSHQTEWHNAIECISCHNDEESLSKVHSDGYENKKAPIRLKQTSVDEETCTGCHDNYEQLAVLTADSTACTDSQGKTVNPHEAKYLTASHEAAITCAGCHEEHTDKQVTDSAPQVCITCHHQKVYECGTCHE